MQDGKHPLLPGSSNVEAGIPSLQLSPKPASPKRKHARTESKSSRASKRMNVADLVQGTIPATPPMSRPSSNGQNSTNVQNSMEDQNKMTHDYGMDTISYDPHRGDVQDGSVNQQNGGYINKILDNPVKSASANTSQGNDIPAANIAQSRPRSGSKRERSKLTIDSNVITASILALVISRIAYTTFQVPMHSPIVFQNYVAAPSISSTRGKEGTSRPSSRDNVCHRWSCCVV